MSHAVYTTDALVCGAYNRNTADRSYTLFTKEAGMLQAEAKSVREERSRQRFALQEFSRIRVSLIKGKHTWKIGSVESQQNDYHEATSREARGSVVVIYRTLRRFIQGQEASPELFDFCLESLDVVVGEVTNRSFVELYCQVQILLQLGYIDSASLPIELKETSIFTLNSKYSPQAMRVLESLLKEATLNSHL